MTSGSFLTYILNFLLKNAELFPIAAGDKNEKKRIKGRENDIRVLVYKEAAPKLMFTFRNYDGHYLTLIPFEDGS